MLAGLLQTEQVVENTAENTGVSLQHLVADGLHLPPMPRDLWIMIGRMAGLPSMSALMQTCRFFRNSFSPAYQIPGRSLPTVTLAERVGYLIRGGYEYEATKLLDKAKTESTLDSVFDAETTVPLTRSKSFKKAPLIFTVLWSLDLYMFDVLKKSYIKPEVLLQQIREYNEPDCEFTKTHGRHFNFHPIIQCWENFSTYIESFTPDALQALAKGSAEDKEFQRLFQLIVTESAKLPMHVINQFLDSARSLVMNGSLATFNEPTLVRTNSIVDMDDGSETICDSLHSKGSDFGVTYGVMRMQSKPVRANVTDALKYAKLPPVTITASDGTESKKSLARVHTEALKTLSEKYLAWQTNVISDAVNSPVSSPKLAKA